MKRRDPWSKRFPSRIYNLVTRLVSGVNIHDFNCGLKAYRAEFDLVVVDDNYDPTRAGKPFLLPEEEQAPDEPLSFDLVRRAFCTEYRRRFADYVASGGTPYPVEPPELWDGRAAVRIANVLARADESDPHAGAAAVQS